MPPLPVTPPDYGDWLAEYRAVHATAGLIGRSRRGKLVVTGSDRFTWLQGMVSQDVRRVEAGERGVDACIVDATGHLVTDLRMTPRGDGILLDLPSENLVRALDLLDGFVISEDVEVVDQSDFLACFWLVGPRTDALWEQVGLPAGSTFSPPQLPGLEGMGAYVGAEQAGGLWDRLVAAGAVPVGETAAETLRIEAGVPRWGAELDETVLPPEAGLDATHVSYEKGCYVGQEVIARIRSRGHTNRALTGLVLEGEVAPDRGSPIHADAAAVGRVTSACLSPALSRVIALGYVRHEYREPGTRLSVLHDGDAIPAVTTPLPFVPSAP